ncbi:MAG TPA: ubiquitin-like small modifier protein 1 [Elusimicrobiota bacterium]|nr:ubiquitin-like small modifier protein 1 [Elusimicrobiota bacterium]
MKVQVHVPTALRQYVEKKEVVELEGATVGAVLDALTGKYAALKKHLVGDDGQLRHFVNVFLNDADIRHLQGAKTPVKDGDVLLIVPSIAGGNAARAAAQEETTFSAEEIKRYSRHLIMPEVGMAGQKKLKEAKVLTIGAGGLGSPLSLYLAAAGVGTIGIVDFDVVELSNLQRQIIHSTDAVGKPKIESARARLLGVNPAIKIQTHETRLTSQNALDIIKGYDIVVDGTDNFATRYLVNDACALLGKPNVYGSIFRFEGQVSVFWAERGPCYRCVYAEPPPPGLVPSCAEGGVLGVLPGVVGALQATETIKLIVGIGEPLIGKLVLFDALKMNWRKLALRKDPGCPVCGTKPSIKTLIDYEEFCGIRGEEKKAAAAGVPEVSVEELKAKMDRGEEIFILDVREQEEYDICRLPGSKLIPLGQLPERVSELNSADEILVHCKMGGRSAKAVKFLHDAGFTKAVNVAGGITAWSERIDPTVPTY